MKAQFIMACSTIAGLPPPSLLEIAVAGRSNCGKSSLINALTGQGRLARTSSTPGRTQQIIFFSVTFPHNHTFHLVDLPGYGYAKTSKTLRRSWAQLINYYIDNRPTLRAMIMLIDIRRPPGPEEISLFEWITGRGIRPFVVLTKSDKLNKNQRWMAMKAAQRALALQNEPLVFSTQKPESVEELRETLNEWIIQELGIIDGGQ